MTEDVWAAREGDGLLHTSMLADITAGVLEVAAYAAITYVGCLVATAAIAAATGVTIATGGLGCVLLGVAVGAVVGIAAGLSGADEVITDWCETAANWLFPPSIEAFITSGSEDVFINGKAAARAAGKLSAAPATPVQAPEPSFMDLAGYYLSQMWRPTVASAEPNAEPCPLDTVDCKKHPAMPEQFLAEGSRSVFINGQPATRSGDRSTCEAKIGSGKDLISPDVRIGGGTVVVRQIESGKLPGVQLTLAALLLLRGNTRGFWTKFPCLIGSALVGAAVSVLTSKVTSALKASTQGAPNPVHAATGAKILAGDEDLDFTLPGLFPIHWQRLYNSLDKRTDGLFGTGWSVSFEVSVQAGADGHLTYTDEQGRQVGLGEIPCPGAAFDPGEGLSARRDEAGNVLIESVQGMYRLFTPTPGNPDYLRLSLIGDRNEGRIWLDHDEQGRVIRLRDQQGLHWINLKYDQQHPQRVSQVTRQILTNEHDTDQENLLSSYFYNKAGQLIAVHDAVGTVQRRFSYDADMNMAQHWHCSGLECFYRWQAYEGPQGSEQRVIEHWTNDGARYLFDYDLPNRMTRVTDSLGRASSHHWDERYQVTRYIDPTGAQWQFDWNSARQLVKAIGPNQGAWNFAYDGSGNLTRITDPLGRTESSTWLPHWALPTTQTDCKGHSWSFRYDKRGNCVEIIDPLGASTVYQRDVQGQPVRITNAAQQSTTLRWDEWGNLSEILDCSMQSTRYEYDNLGHCVRLIDAEGRRHEYHNDARGNLLERRLPGTGTERFVRDCAGALVGYIDAAGAEVKLTRSPRGLILSRTNRLGHTLDLTYDAYGRVNTLRNENGDCYRFSWDDADRLVEQVDIDQSGKRYRYDSLGDICEVEFFPDGSNAEEAPIHHHLQRDVAGRLIRKVTQDGISEYSYDALDQLLSVNFEAPDGQQQCLSFRYDALGRIVEERSDDGAIRHTYDELDNPLTTRLPDGRSISRMFYGNGHLHQLNVDNILICDFERDRLHREIHRSQGQISTLTEYGTDGRVRSQQQKTLHQPWQLPGQRQMDYSYDVAGQLVRTTLTDSRQADHHAYDAIGQVRFSQQAQHPETFAYDAAANLLAPGTQGPVRHNRLQIHADKRYRYDGFGRLVEKRSGRSLVQHFKYDNEQRLIEVVNVRGAKQTVVKMAYDPLGRRVSKIELDPQGRVLGDTRFLWEGMRLLQETRFQLKSVFLYTHGSYDPIARVDGSGGNQRVLYFHNDLSGMPRRLTDIDGRVVWSADFMHWGNCRLENSAIDLLEEQNLRFQGQYLDRETGLHYNTLRYYDPDIGRFTQPDPIGLAGGTNLYLYAPNTQSWIDPLGLRCTLKANNPKQAHAMIQEKWGYRMSSRDMKELQATIDNIKLRRPAHQRDGIEFENNFKYAPQSQRLNTGSGPYEEWRVRTPGGSGAGARRIVVDKKTGQAYYTHDHYDSYIEIDMGGWK